MKGTWIGELLATSEEEIQKFIDALPEISQNESEKISDTTEDGQEITRPHFLGEMNQYEKALNALIYKKNLQHKEVCEKEHAEDFKDFFSPDHEELHRVLPILRYEMWNSIHGRFPDAPGDEKTLSMGGKIFATQSQKHPMEEAFEEMLKERGFPSGRISVGVFHL